MGMALDLARLGLGRTSPNPMVGAVIVKNGKVLSTGFHRKAGMPHAEVEAMNSVGATGRSPLHGATMYVTLEPCCHHGRTPPCTDAIIKNGIKGVVIGMRDPDPKVAGKGIKILKKAGLRIRVGVLEEECRQLNKAYVKHRTQGLPYVILKAAMTADGKVGFKRRRGEARHRPCRITGPAAIEQAHVLRDQVDAILVGVGTVLSDNPRLTTRLKGRKGKDPIRVILDSRLRIPIGVRVLIRRDSPTIIATAASIRHPKISLLRKKGVEILFCKKDKSGRIPLLALLKQLALRGVLSLLVEGGPRVWSSLLRQGLVDEAVLFIAPQVLGAQGLPFLENVPDSKLLFKQVSQRVVGCDMMIEATF